MARERSGRISVGAVIVEGVVHSRRSCEERTREQGVLHRGYSKSSDISPTQPRCAKTRRSAGKAAADENTGGTTFSPGHLKLRAQFAHDGLLGECFQWENTVWEKARLWVKRL